MPKEEPSRTLPKWQTIDTQSRYEEGSQACRNYSQLTMRVRTLTQVVLGAFAAALIATLLHTKPATSNVTLETSVDGTSAGNVVPYVALIAGLGMIVLSFTLATVDWHYQSAFRAIRNYLSSVEGRARGMRLLERLTPPQRRRLPSWFRRPRRRHTNTSGYHRNQLRPRGPWWAHHNERTWGKDHIASYLPFVLLFGAGCAAFCYGLGILWPDLKPLVTCMPLIMQIGFGIFAMTLIIGLVVFLRVVLPRRS